MKLQSRLALVVAASAAIAIFLTASAFWVIATREQRTSTDEALLRVAQQPRAVLADAAADEGRGRNGPRAALGAILEARPDDDRLFTLVRVTGPTGRLLIDDGLPEVTPGAEAELETIVLNGERYRMVSARIGPDANTIVQIARNIEDAEAGLQRLRNRILLGSLLGIGLAGLLGALVANRLTAPIVAVSSAAKSMAARQDLPSRITVDRSDEIGDLATSFNQMLAALEVSRDQQRRLVADASHELRTPLTSLRLKIDLLDSTPELPEKQRQDLLRGSAAELERLSDLVAELVSLATDPTATDEAPTEASLAALANAVAQTVRQRDARSVEVQVVNDERQVMRPTMVRRAISNLVGNAVKYSGPELPITVVVDGSSIEVRDRGEGIPDADLPHVFDRFFRSPTARTRPGNGIGLAIVAQVAEVHGGSTWARNADDGGAIVGFSVA